MNFCINSACIALMLLSFQPLASPERGWTFDSADNGITIHFREQSDGLVEVKAQMFTPTTYGGFLRLLQNTAKVPEWVDNVSDSVVVKQISPSENIVYTQFSAPWPAKDRDMLTYSKFRIDAEGFRLEISDAPQAILPPQADYIRITSVHAVWRLKKLTDGHTHIEYTVFADPGGALPNWLINKLAKESARTTFENLRDQLAHFQTDEHPEINE
ncbi:hypothetical protein BOO24_02515 [Vibrio navarrensis]|uniref:START domain-containing protein n=2 Tax=Vibrio navarrensis TaxID=29495 RepID=UPI00186A1B8F|nr:hypothetical protein [Vibrio navarrensis]MBE4591232.1 hypothetical protein [Vibrio navarrensis]